MRSVQFSSGLFFGRKNNNERHLKEESALKLTSATPHPLDETPASTPGPEPEAPATPSPASFSVNRANFKYSSGVQLENKFISSLRRSKNPQEKAGLAEILGRAHSINALPDILSLLSDEEETEVRTVAAEAVSEIGSATHPNSFTATELTDTLLQAYRHRKEKIAERLSKPAHSLPYDDRLKEEETRQELMTELKTLLLGISRLNVAKGRKAIQEEYQKTLVLSLMNDEEVQEMIRATELAEETFHKELEKKYQKPISQILNEIPKEELEELKKKVTLRTPKGESINLLEALTQIAFLKEKQEQFASELLLGLMDAIALHEDKVSTAALKMALTNGNPDIKARSLKLLRQRNSLNYNSDVYPNLYARDQQVRKAALKALLHSQELAAKQKTMELLKPNSYMDLAGGFSSGGMKRYGKFLERIAENGDEYIDALTNRALHSDYDLETRQISLLVLGMMTQKPAALSVSPQTLMQAQVTIKVLAQQPPARSPEDFEALSLTATKMWAAQGDPEAIASAIALADSKKRRLTGQQQAGLLRTVFSVLQEDKKRSESERRSETQHQILDIMSEGKHPSLKENEAEKLRQELAPRAIYSKLNTQDAKTFLENNRDENADPGLIKALAAEADELRPFLTSLAESEKSLMTQMLAIRILGLLQDDKSLKYLKNRVHDPLKGKIDWKADISYQGSPANAAANLRMNTLAALGDIGDSRALDVMTDALDDPILKNFVPEPLGKVAKHANEKVTAAKLGKVRTKLVRLMETPDTSRSMRAVRIKAADALFQFKGGVEEIKEFAARTPDPNFKRHALSALLSNDYGADPDHMDHDLVKSMIHPGLGVERLHEQGITGKGVQMAIVDGGYVDPENREGFQDRVKLPAIADEPEHVHPTMVMSTAAANGKLKGVAPDAVVFSDKWPDFGAVDTMDVYKKIIEGKLRGENDVKVINNSWGFSSPNAILHKDVRKILRDYKNVVDLAEKAGIQMVFAAGNEGENAAFPKIGTLSVFGMDIDKLTGEDTKTVNYILDKVILAGALNTQGDDENRANHRIAGFSSRGDSLNRKLKPTVIAPGADMMVYSWDKHKGNPKTLVNGTSFASPYVSGLLTLMLQKNPNLTPAELREILKKTSVKLAEVPLTEQGNGEVQPEAAVKMAEKYAQLARKRKTSDTDAPDDTSNGGAAGSGGGLRRRKTTRNMETLNTDMPLWKGGHHALISAQPFLRTPTRPA